MGRRKQYAWFATIAVLDIIAWFIFITFVVAVIGFVIAVLLSALEAGGF